MKCSRRSMLVGMLSLPAIPVAAKGSAGWNWSQPAYVSEVWGLSFYAVGATPVMQFPKTARREIPAVWHPEFL